VLDARGLPEAVRGERVGVIHLPTPAFIVGCQEVGGQFRQSLVNRTRDPRIIAADPETLIALLLLKQPGNG